MVRDKLDLTTPYKKQNVVEVGNLMVDVITLCTQADA